MSIYLDRRAAAPNRVKSCHDELEYVLSEAAVMIAFAEYLLSQGATYVELHPDGEHGKRHNLKQTLGLLGFEHATSEGSTAYGGSYTRGGQTIAVTLKPGLGDVVGKLNGQTVYAECKGGVINTRHSGQLSRLRTGLCEVVGLLMARSQMTDRHIVVVPNVPVTAQLAKKMHMRCSVAGIEIALVNSDGTVSFVSG